MFVRVVPRYAEGSTRPYEVLLQFKKKRHRNRPIVGCRRFVVQFPIGRATDGSASFSCGKGAVAADDGRDASCCCGTPDLASPYPLAAK